MHTYIAHGLPYFISSSGVMQFREFFYTVVSYAPYILLQNYTIADLATFLVAIFNFFHPGPQPTNPADRIIRSDGTKYVIISCVHKSFGTQNV